ncbi:MAG: preprotein translocase subunit SecG, partial [Kiloniellales bacterium]|nr:preprotein translocase subunit SecG [Kiloniellales bacterium]
ALTKATIALAAAFMVTSIILSILASGDTRPRSIVDDIPAGVSSGTDSQESSGDSPSIPSVPLE